MKNHVHLLIKSNKLSDFMRKVGAKYVYWYNWKYDRVGSLFQGRYKSEVVEDDGYFLTVLRYIHQNPIKANITKTINEYEFSSYNEYIKLNDKKIIETDFALGMLPLKEFIKFHHEINNDKCLDIIEVRRINDEVAKSIIYRVSQCKNPSEFQALDLYQRDKHIKTLKDKGLSIRQIERLTGINRGIVLKA